MLSFVELISFLNSDNWFWIKKLSSSSILGVQINSPKKSKKLLQQQKTRLNLSSHHIVKGQSMFFTKNSNHKIYWSDLQVLFMVRNLYLSNSPVLLFMLFIKFLQEIKWVTIF